MPLPARRMPEQPWTDGEVIDRVLAGDVPLFELLMRRHNERVYRAVRSILRDETEAEDAMQAAYLHAYAHLREFESRAAFATWLTRIAIHEALGRRRRNLKRVTPTDDEVDVASEERSPEQVTEDAENRKLLEAAIDELPEHFRTVFVLREVQQLSVEETAKVLEIVPQTVKTRLHRARKLLRAALLSSLPRALPFEATRCDRVVAAVLPRIIDGNLS